MSNIVFIGMCIFLLLAVGVIVGTLVADVVFTRRNKGGEE